MTVRFWLWRHFWPLFVLLGATVVLVSWVTGLFEYVRHFGSDYSTMKFTTAMMFIVTSVALLTYHSIREGAAVVLLVMLAYTFFGGYFAPGLLPTFGDVGVQSIAPGTPSLATMICFAAIFGWASWLDHNWQASISAGILVALVGIVALVGYWVDNPLLYFYSPHSTGMAKPTAVLFVACGYHIVKTEFLKHSRGENYAK
jgi:hypothetical protein